jgi:hypothetical protein
VSIKIFPLRSYNTATGETFAASGGMHIYLQVEDGSDIRCALTALSEKLWLNGCGWLNVSAAGQILFRSIVDASVGWPERLVFEGAPIIQPPLRQDPRARRPMAIAGIAVDTRRAIPSLSEAERAQLEQLRGAERRRIASEIMAARAAADIKLAREIASREGIPIEVAKRCVCGWSTRGITEKLTSWKSSDVACSGYLPQKHCGKHHGSATCGSTQRGYAVWREKYFYYRFRAAKTFPELPGIQRGLGFRRR